MNQTDKGPEGNGEVCSTTEVQYAEKNGQLRTRGQERSIILQKMPLTSCNPHLEAQMCKMQGKTIAGELEQLWIEPFPRPSKTQYKPQTESNQQLIATTTETFKNVCHNTITKS